MSRKQSYLENMPETHILTENFDKIPKMAGSSEISNEFSTENVVKETYYFEDFGGYGSAGAIFEIFEPEVVSTTSVDAGTSVKRYKKMLYAHASEAFSDIRGMYPGEVFFVTENGERSMYQIVIREVYEKATELDGKDKYHNWFRNNLYSANYIVGDSIISGHDVVLMTCGTGEGSIDSNYRLVLFADRVE